MPAIGSSYVDVSFHPTSSEGGDTFTQWSECAAFSGNRRSRYGADD